MMDEESAKKELARLRNRHVAKLLTYLGDAQPYLESAIKKSMSQFAQDVEVNIINSDNSEVKQPCQNLIPKN